MSILRENGFVSDERGSMARDKAVQKKNVGNRLPFRRAKREEAMSLKVSPLCRSYKTTEKQTPEAEIGRAHV